MSILLIITILLLVPYAMLMAILLWGWHRTRLSAVNRQIHPPRTRLSVVVAFRNEASQIHSLLNSLAIQDYPHERMEVFLVNDHSEDRSAEAAAQWASRQPFKARVLHNVAGEKGKKAALTRGIQAASGELIVTTDADCTMKAGWLTSVARFYEQKPVELVASPVLFDFHARRFFEKFQALELLTLVGTTAGSIGAGRPLFCNAANMAFRRSTFLGLNDPFMAHTPSGDDTMLLQQIKAVGSHTIAFNPDPASVVTTIPVKSIHAFWNQRKRWVSKSRYYKDRHILGAGLIVLLTNLWLVVLIAGTLVNPGLLMLLVSAFAFKILADLLLMRPLVRYFEKQKLWEIYLPAQLVYPIYSTLTGIFGRLTGFSWKNRNYHVN
jgi:cellulose synthase/poly-beta-1,6-N-acetylglucosamine synthase-like glycosyltransferase